MGVENRPPTATKTAPESASYTMAPDETYRSIIDLNPYLPPDMAAFDATLPVMPRPTDAPQSIASPGYGRAAVVGGRHPASNDQWGTLGAQGGQVNYPAGNAFRASRLVPSDVTPRASRAFETGQNTAPQGGIPLIPVVKIQAPLPDFNFEYQGVPTGDERPSTAASVDTFQQAQTLFQDFDGTHYAPSVRVPSPGNAKRDTFIRAPAPDNRPRYPPPNTGMVYYPAPVPATLNLPKRLSRAPPAHMEAKRRTQLLSAITPDARKSAIWLNDAPDAGQLDEEEARKIRARLSTLPPQLRASMFFETPIGKQEVEIKDNSAVATLDTLLDASTDMPVSAFTDHPFVGKIGSEVYKLDGKVKHHTMDIDDETRRRPLWQELRRKSLTSMSVLADGNKAKKKRSRAFSLGAELDTAQTGSQKSGDEDDEEGSGDDSESEEGEDPHNHGPPTTLLAELQFRKAAQKLRSRTALSAFPNGMHSTLLELDAVAQVRKSKRQNARVTLAWEDPGAAARAVDEDESSDEEDIPLGMLFGGNRKVREQMKDRGMGAWDRPLGLIEQRERDDNEPLSHRRARLRGVDPLAPPPVQARPWSVAPAMQLNGEEHGSDEEKEEEETGETLAERIKRLKGRKDGEDQPTPPLDARPISQAFSEELLGRFGADGTPPPLEDPDAPEEEEEEETLGQRRARLAAQQQQQQARQSTYALDGGMGTGNIAQAPARPVRRASGNLADLLHSVPVGATRKVSDRDFVVGLPQDSLLKKSEETRAAHVEALRAAQDARAAQFAPGANTMMGALDPAAGRATAMGFRGGLYNNGFGGAGVPAMDPRMSVYANPAMAGSAQALALQQQAQQQQQLMMLAGFQQQMTMMAGMAAPGTPMMGFPAAPAMASTPNLLGGMGAQGLGGGAAGGSTPNLLAGGAGMVPPAYARHSTASMGGAMPPAGMQGLTAAQQQMMLEEPFLDEPGRERIDAWRQSVQMD